MEHYCPCVEDAPGKQAQRGRVKFPWSQSEGMIELELKPWPDFKPMLYFPHPLHSASH